MEKRKEGLMVKTMSFAEHKSKHGLFEKPSGDFNGL